MKKIPTLFVRDENDRRYVTPTVTPGCEWVLAGEGVATRKYDGTAVRLLENGEVAVRREVKPGKPMPDRYMVVEQDETTGKTVGWEPADQSGFAKYIKEAIGLSPFAPGTYELIGPKINGNPEGADRHVLVRHGNWELANVPRTFDELAAFLTNVDFGYEGIVWHHPDGRMAKLKRRDFPKVDA